jgi:hypothetical protein
MRELRTPKLDAQSVALRQSGSCRFGPSDKVVAPCTSKCDQAACEAVRSRNGGRYAQQYDVLRRPRHRRKEIKRSLKK